MLPCMTTSLRIGVIADTHGLLRPEALAALQGCERILHLGDIGPASLLDQLRELAPLDVVRGNNDTDDWAGALPETLLLELGGLRLYLIHDLKQLAIDPVAEGIDVVVAGHSHKPLSEVRDGVLYLNPGSAGPRRFKLPIALAILTVVDGTAEVEMVSLVHQSIFPERPHHKYPTKNNFSQDIYLPIPCSELLKNSIIYNAKKLFNHLPLHLKSIPTCANFRIKTKEYLLERPFYSINEFYSE